MNERDLRDVRGAILFWYGGSERDLPWRGTRDPYLIWVSEIMLQQTRAEAVKPYYLAFTRDWPDVHSLASAQLEQVLKRWEGLGYYSRARNLHSAAIYVTNKLGGMFPTNAHSLQDLPGVGEYTAGMIASIAYNEPSPAIDGNQIRVLARLFEITEPARGKAGMAKIREAAHALIDRARPGDFNQALMDLGAGVCLPRNPCCEDCPAKTWCMARAAGDPQRLPVLPERVKQRVERRGVALVIAEKCVLVQRRPEAGLLGGLWQFPNFENAVTARELSECLLELGLAVRSIAGAGEVEHVFTHLIWRQSGRAFRAGEARPVGGMEWVDAKRLVALPMPVAMAHYREEALKYL